MLLSKSAIESYDSDQYPKTLKKYGARLTTINNLRRVAAQKALLSKNCEFVEWSEVSDRSQLHMLEFSVDCSGVTTFSYTENDLKK